MLRFVKFTLFFIALTVIPAAFQPETASALSGNEWKAGNIIDDSRYYLQGDLSIGEIQNHLNAKVPSCDTWGTKPYGGTTRAEYGRSKGNPPPFTCLRNYSMDTQGKASSSYCSAISAGRKTAAQIIHDVSKSCGISTKALIVLLEKEQGLVSDEWPFEVQYRSATGYGCPDTAPCDAEYYGFYNQVYNAARQFKLYASTPNSYRYRPYQVNSIQFNPNASCGASNVYIENKATAGLYNYTPYQPNQSALNNLYGSGDSCGAYGNRNFWRLYNDWFGSTSAPFSIIKKASSSQLYLYDGNIKYLIPTWEVFQAYGFDRYTSFVLSDSYIDGLANGNALTTLSRSTSGVVYLNAKGQRYSVSGQQCTDWGLDCFNPYALNTLSNDALGLTPSGGSLQPLMENAGTVYRMVNGKKQPMLSYQAMAERGYDWSKVTKVEARNASQPIDVLLLHELAALKFPSSATIYIYSGGQFYTVPNYDSFVDWRIDRFYVDSTPSSTFDSTLPTSIGTLPTAISNSTDSYIINRGQKLRITDLTSNWPATTNLSGLSGLLNTLPTRNVSNSNTFRADTGEIFTVSNKVRRAIQSVDDFYTLGFNPDLSINLSQQPISLLERGPNLLPGGVPFKKNDGNGRIFVSNTQGASLVVPTYELFVRYRFTQDVRNIDATTAAAYPETNILRSYMNNQSNEKVVLSTQDSLYYRLDGSTSALWGIPSSPVSFKPQLSNQVKKDGFRFARNNSGQIYYADNGCKRLISSYSKFMELGGNNDNVMSVYDDFLSDLCSGSNI